MTKQKIISIYINGSDVNTITVYCNSIGCITYIDSSKNDEPYMCLVTIHNKEFKPVIEFNTKMDLNGYEDSCLDSFLVDDYSKEDPFINTKIYEINDAFNVKLL